MLTFLPWTTDSSWVNTSEKDRFCMQLQVKDMAAVDKQPWQSCNKFELKKPWQHTRICYLKYSSQTHTAAFVTLSLFVILNILHETEKNSNKLFGTIFSVSCLYWTRAIKFLASSSSERVPWKLYGWRRFTLSNSSPGKTTWINLNLYRTVHKGLVGMTSVPNEPVLLLHVSINHVAVRTNIAICNAKYTNNILYICDEQPQTS